MFSFNGGSPDLPFSVAFWMNASDMTTSQYVIIKGEASKREWQINIGSSKISTSVLNAAGTAYRGVTAPFTDTGVWHHFLITYSGGGATGSFKIYIDNVESNNATLTGGTFTGMVNGTANLYFGQYNNGSYFVGLLDDVRIYNNVLSEAERALVMNNSPLW